MQWIPGYEGLYKVSRVGDITSYKRKQPIVMKTFISPTGYLHLELKKDNVKKNYRVHRLVTQTYIDNPENKPQVNHIDGNKLNNSIENLEWCTSSENNKHAYKSGLKCQNGEKNHQSKLLSRDIRNIRDMRNNGHTHQYIANKFNIARQTVGDICNRRRWGHI